VVFSHDFISAAALRAQMDLRHGAKSHCLAGHSLGVFHDLSELVRGTKAERYLQDREYEKAKENISLHYEMDDFEEQTHSNYHQEILNILDLIKSRQPHLQMFHVKGEEYYSWQGFDHHVRFVDIYRLKASDGYCCDFSFFEDNDRFAIKSRHAHIKYIVQDNVERQGNGLRMFRFINDCADVLFNDGIYMLWGWARRINPYSVRSTRNGSNWREAIVKIKDSHGEESPSMIRLLALYLRNGWILTGLRKEIDEEIVLCSPDAIQMMFERIGNDAADSFKYSKNYETIVSDYKI